MLLAAIIFAALVALAFIGRRLVLRRRARRVSNIRKHAHAFAQGAPERHRERKVELREFLAETRTAAMADARGFDTRDADERRRRRNKRKAAR